MCFWSLGGGDRRSLPIRFRGCSAWRVRVLANRRRGHQRAVALVDRLTQEALATRGPEALDDLDLGVLRALDSLGEADRELLLLVAWEGLSRRELASVLGVNANAVGVRLLRARRRLARALAAPAESQPALSGQAASIEEVP